METISLLQLVQATSGLAGRNNTQLFVDGKPVIEIRIAVTLRIEVTRCRTPLK